MSTSSINRLDESWKYIPEVSFLLPRIRICSHFSTCIVPARIHVYVWEKYKIIYFFIIWLKYIEVHRMSCRCFKSLLEEFIVAEEGIGNIVGWYIWFTLVPQFLDKHSRLCSIYMGFSMSTGSLLPPTFEATEKYVWEPNEKLE